MIALDTNILARLYVLDDNDSASHQQHQQVVKLFNGRQRLFVPKTVMLEFEWVLRGHYRYLRDDILRVFDHLLALPMVRLEDSENINAAVESYRAGLDFADALHLASSGQSEQFMTFDDRGFVRPAIRMKLKPTVMLPGK